MLHITLYIMIAACYMGIAFDSLSRQECRKAAYEYAICALYIGIAIMVYVDLTHFVDRA